MTAVSRRVKRARQLWQRERYDLARIEAERFPTPAQVTAKARKRAAT
jgi:hypothetical protein